MTTTGYLLRVDQVRQNAQAKLCSCGHPVGDHFEKRDICEVVEGMPVIRRHHDYAPLLFFCNHQKCSCKVQF